MVTQGYVVTSGRRERSIPSPPALCGHPRHCSITPGTVATPPTLLKRTGTGRRHVRHCTSYDLPLTPPSSQPADGGRTPTSTLLPSKSLLYGHKTRHDASTGARFARTGVNSAALLAIPLHVGKIVRQDCKLPSPWPIKGGAIPQPQGAADRVDRHTRTPFAPHPDIGTRLNQYLWDLEDQPPLPPRL
jgi:hypothetical protein